MTYLRHSSFNQATVGDHQSSPTAAVNVINAVDGDETDIYPSANSIPATLSTHSDTSFTIASPYSTMADNMPTLRNDLSMVARKARLTSAVEDVDSIIARLLEAREKIAAGETPSGGSLD